MNPLPRLDEETFEALKVDIEVNGILDPVERCADCGVLIDGWHRAEIGESLALEIPTRDQKLPVCSDDAHWAWAVRRNLNNNTRPALDSKALREEQKERFLRLRDEDRLTQEQCSGLLGVPVSTLSRWEKAASNSHSGNASTRDRRRKLSDDDIETIVSRLAAGETHQSIADDLGDDIQVTRQRISQIADDNRHRIVTLPYEVNFVEVRCGDARDHWEGDIADLALFSPPYNVGIDYDSDDNGDALTDDEWQEVVGTAMAVLRDGWQVGRIVINVPAALDRNPYRPVELPEVDGLVFEAQIVWDKGTTGNRTTWGSWRQPSAPALRDRTERLWVYRTENVLRGYRDALVTEGDKQVSPLVSAAQFTALTQDLWSLPPETQGVGHPAPFPVRLAENVIRLYGWEGCTVIDPFAGSGTTGIAAASLGCRAVLNDQSETYCRLALKRLMEAFG